MKLKEIISQVYQKDSLKIFNIDEYTNINRIHKNFKSFSKVFTQLAVDLFFYSGKFLTSKGIYLPSIFFKKENEYIFVRSKFKKNWELTLTLISLFLFFTIKNLKKITFDLEISPIPHYTFPKIGILFEITTHLPTKKSEIEGKALFYNFYYPFIFLITFQAISLKAK